MRPMPSVWILAFAMFLTPVYGQGTAPATPREKAAKVIELQFSQQAFTAAVENTVPQYINTIRLKNPSLTLPQIKLISDIYKQTLMDMRQPNKDAAADAWIEIYTEEEIDALYTFYTSAAGVSIAGKQAALTQSIQSKQRVTSQTILSPELLRRLKNEPALKDLSF